jgi:hypothetical protein
VSRNAIRRCTVPAGEPAGTVSVATDDAGQVTLMLSDEHGDALQAALSHGQAARLAWHLLSLSEPRSAASWPAPAAS